MLYNDVRRREASGGGRDIFGWEVGGLQRRLKLHIAALWLAGKVEVRWYVGVKRESEESGNVGWENAAINLFNVTDGHQLIQLFALDILDATHVSWQTESNQGREHYYFSLLQCLEGIIFLIVCPLWIIKTFKYTVSVGICHSNKWEKLQLGNNKIWEPACNPPSLLWCSCFKWGLLLSKNKSLKPIRSGWGSSMIML